jgi:hypothetical protein
MNTSPSPSRTARINLLLTFSLLALAVLGCVTPTCDRCDPGRYRPGATYSLTYPPGDANAVSSVVADASGCIHYPRPDSTNNCGSVKASLSGTGFFFFAPSTIDFQAPSATFTITGTDIDASNGMPLIQITHSGVLVAQTTATEVGNDGTWLQAQTPDLTYAYTGTYDVQVSTADESGQYFVLSYATMDVINNDPPPPPPDPCDGNPNCNPCYLQRLDRPLPLDCY